MSNVIDFTPRPRPPEPEALPLAGLGLRAHLEEAAQTALDAADRIIAALDLMEDADPALMAMAAHAGQVVRLREPATPIEVEPTPVPPPVPQESPPADPEPTLEEVAPQEPVPEAIILPWRGAGNVVSAAGCAVLSLVGMRA
ncbi:MAG: hypothetical protein INR70_38785 [Parafilimonas terrae]|nr:hypothetical protein [Parafilimonas terrae]